MKRHEVDGKGLINLVLEKKDQEIIYLSQKNAADYIGRTVHTLIRWGHAGIVKPIKLVGRVNYNKTELERLKANGVKEGVFNG